MRKSRRSPSLYQCVEISANVKPIRGGQNDPQYYTAASLAAHINQSVFYM